MQVIVYESIYSMYTLFYHLSTDWTHFIFCVTYTIEGKADRVISIEMFEHMKNYELLMKKVSNWIKPGGKVRGCMDGLSFIYVACMYVCMHICVLLGTRIYELYLMYLYTIPAEFYVFPTLHHVVKI